MTGWPAVFATTGLMLIALIGFNVRLWRRLRANTAAAKLRAAAGGVSTAGGDASTIS